MKCLVSSMKLRQGTQRDSEADRAESQNRHRRSSHSPHLTVVGRLSKLKRDQPNATFGPLCSQDSLFIGAKPSGRLEKPFGPCHCEAR